ncbi:hypothetical protein HPB52_002887 [Rhipicephalus sanguineus]|uniref:HTH psq-type domain-containing protein n=1 Tax=Rhipicephalus sanguineus TaxID=34632 RepID=A0A9D4PTW3_RHISA|nr:hypothetical protein HPB52_002887 [Rhipicephalus sanguineus]
MLYALHRVVAAAGHKMSDLMRRSVTASVSSYLSSSEDGCRTAAAGCLGSLCRWLPPDELAIFAREHLLSDDPSEDWTLRHGCSVTLSVALKQAPERILTDDWRDRVVKTLIKYMTADRVPIVIGGVRGTGHCLRHLLLVNSEELPQVLLTTFAKLKASADGIAVACSAPDHEAAAPAVPVPGLIVDLVTVMCGLSVSTCDEAPRAFTMATRGPYRMLDLATKVKILKEVEQGGTAKQDIARKYGIKPNTLSNILKNKRSVLDAFENDQFKMSRKRMCTGAHPDGADDDASCTVGEEDTSELDVDGLLPALGDVPFEVYVATDSSVETCGALSDGEIVEMVRPSEPSHETEVDDDAAASEPLPRAADVAAGLALAQRFFTAESNAEEALGHIYSLQDLLSAARFSKQKQTAITDFFS